VDPRLAAKAAKAPVTTSAPAVTSAGATVATAAETPPKPTKTWMYSERTSTDEKKKKVFYLL
jgi:hypothetical protein